MQDTFCVPFFIVELKNECHDKPCPRAPTATVRYAMAHLDGGDPSRCVTFLIESSLETMPHTTGAQDTKPCTCKRMREAGTEKKRAAKSDEISGARQ